VRDRPFRQLDVFGAEPLRGNPLAVVADADDLPDDTLAAIANWTNLSETTFLLRPVDPAADYRVRIFTPSSELPFAGHPTLGSCAAWLDLGGRPRQAGRVVQECGVGLVEVAVDGPVPAFAAPPLQRSGPLEPGERAAVLGALGLDAAQVVDVAWVDNGPGWIGVLVHDEATVLAVHPDGLGHRMVGVVGPRAPGADEAFEVRAFFPVNGATAEDPVTGSLNASLAQWLIGTGRARPPYLVRQGTALGRRGRVHVTTAADAVWIGGRVEVAVRGTLRC
jgi:PhzF family phenazine biosynthesis protein